MIKLPEQDGTLTPYEPNREPWAVAYNPARFQARSVLATAHVLGDPLADNEPFGPPGGPPPQSADWESTLAAELIRQCGAEARAALAGEQGQ
jgi:hypothetical protein